MFEDTQLTPSHVVGCYSESDFGLDFAVWDRTTGQCIREIYDGGWYSPGLCGSHLILSCIFAADGDPLLGIWDSDTPEEGPVFLSNQPATTCADDTILVGDRELYHIHTMQTEKVWSHPFEAITVYSVDTRDVVRQISLSEPVPRFSQPGCCFSQGLVVMKEDWRKPLSQSAA